MKKTIIIILAFALLLAVASFEYPKLRDNYIKGENANTNTDIGTETNTETEIKISATDFTVYDKDGNDVKLSDLVGKPTIVNFWASWCGYCVEELPGFNNLYEEFGASVNFLMVDLPDGQYETKSKALKFIEEKNYKFPVYFDTDYSAVNAYSISGIPMTLFVDEYGNLYKTHSGYISEATLRNYIDKILN